MLKQENIRISGKYSCPHCNQSLVSHLGGWDDSAHTRCPNPKCGKFHFIPPVSLRDSSNKSNMSYLVICPNCYEVANIESPEKDNMGKCSNCNSKVIIAPLKNQLEFTSEFYTDEEDAKDTSKGVSEKKNNKKVEWKRIFKSYIPVKLTGKRFRLEVLLENPYWLLGLSSSADEKEVARSLQKIKSRFKLGREIPLQLSLGGEIADSLFPKETEGAQSRLDLLKNPIQNFIYSIFWPGKKEGGKLEKDYIETLRSSKKYSPEIAHSVAASCLIKTVAVELDYIAGKCSEAPKELWLKAFLSWSYLLTSAGKDEKSLKENFKNDLVEKVRKLGSLELREDMIEDLMSDLPKFILSLTIPFIEIYIRSGRLSDVKRLIGSCLKSGFDQKLIKEFLYSTISEMSRVPIEDLVSRAGAPFESKGKVNWGQIAKRFDPIFDDAEDILSNLSTNFNMDKSLESKLKFDSLIDVVLNAIENKLDINIQLKEEQRLKNLLQGILTLDKAMNLPMDKASEYRVKGVLHRFKRQLYPADWDINEEWDPVNCFFLPGEKASPFHSIILPLNKITNVTLTEHKWNKRYVLVPRSALAGELHEGGLETKDLIDKCKKSPRIQAVHDSGSKNKIRFKSFNTVYDSVDNALKEVKKEIKALSKELDGNVSPNADNLLKLQDSLKTLEEMKANFGTWSRVDFLKKRCGVSSLWVFYLPSLILGGGISYFISYESITGLFLKIGVANQMLNLSSTIPKFSVFGGLGILSGVLIHMFQFARWKVKSGLRYNKIKKDLKNINNQLNTLAPEYVKSLETFKKLKTNLINKINHSVKKARESVSILDGDLKFKDLRSKQSPFPIYAECLSQGYEKGEQPSSIKINTERMKIINNAKESEINAIFIQFGRVDLTRASIFEKREILRKIVRKNI